MNCLDYRRALLAEGRESNEMKLHRVQCAACAQSLAEHEAFEGELRRGLEVPVPRGLEERLASGHAARRRRFLAAAGISALAAGLRPSAGLRPQHPPGVAARQVLSQEH